MLAVSKVLLGDPLPPLKEATTSDRSTAKTISDVRRAHAPYWKCFQTSDIPASTPTPSYRTSTSTPTLTATTTTQRKRKRKNSDTEYTPHQNNQPTAPTVVRKSRRLAVSTKPEQQSTTVTSTNPLSSRSTPTERSSSLTSASSSSFDRLPTPKDLDTSDFPALTSKPKRARIKQPETTWTEDTSSDEDAEPDIPIHVKIGPPRRRRPVDTRQYVTDITPVSLSEVSGRLPTAPYL